MLSAAEAEEKRWQLVEDGFTVVPGVLPPDLLEALRDWSESIFSRVPVDPKYRYQGSDIHAVTPRRWREMGDLTPDERRFPDPMVERLVDLPEQAASCCVLGLEGLRPDDVVIILSKPAYGPPLYWHQDFMQWNHPSAAAPWPTRIFLSYYLTDTCRENGCLRVIPGTHRKRIPLHDLLPAAHGPEIQAIEDLDHPVFMDHPDAVDVPVRAGDLVIADARVLHAAWPNQTAQRRTLLLQWHSVFPFPNSPSWWRGEVPEVVTHFDPTITYEPTRIPGEHLA